MSAAAAAAAAVGRERESDRSGQYACDGYAVIEWLAILFWRPNDFQNGAGRPTTRRQGRRTQTQKNKTRIADAYSKYYAGLTNYLWIIGDIIDRNRSPPTSGPRM